MPVRSSTRTSSTVSSSKRVTPGLKTALTVVRPVRRRRGSGSRRSASRSFLATVKRNAPPVRSIRYSQLLASTIDACDSRQRRARPCPRGRPVRLSRRSGRRGGSVPGYGPDLQRGRDPTRRDVPPLRARRARRLSPQRRARAALPRLHLRRARLHLASTAWRLRVPAGARAELVRGRLRLRGSAGAARAQRRRASGS